MKHEQEKKLLLFLKGCSILWHSSPKHIASIFIISFLQGLVGPASAIIWQNIIDVITSMIQLGEWVQKGTFLLFVFLVINLANYLLTECAQNIRATFCDILNQSITTSILHKALRLSMTDYDNPYIYNHLRIASTETSENCLSLLEVISAFISSFIQLISYIFLIFRFGWFIVPISIISALPLLYTSMKMGSYWHEVIVNRSESSRLIEYMKQLMIKNENIKEIRLYQIGTKIVTRINEVLADFIESDKKARKRLSARKMLSQSIDETIAITIKVIIVLIGISTRCSIGTIVLYFNSQDGLKGAIVSLISQTAILHRSLLYLESIQILDELGEKSKTQDKKAFNPDFREIEFRDVSFKYPGATDYVLKNLSFKIENGKTYSIVGLNGSGKTTLIKLLLRLYAPTEGRIYIDGCDIETIDINEYYSNISAVFQDFVRLPFTMRENIAIRGNWSDDRFSKAIHTACLEEIIDSLPQKENTLLLKEWSNGVDISQGQWQRVAIARSCYEIKAICLLDEPFSSLDALSETQILEKIREQRDSLLTVFITHRFSSISLADRILVMRNGLLVESGTHCELMRKEGLYHKLYTAQIKRINKDKDQMD